jgi:hypothetical protein
VPDNEYVGSYSGILDVLGHEPAAATVGLVDAKRIDAILDAKHRKWVDFSFDRLARFGYGFDKF